MSNYVARRSRARRAPALSGWVDETFEKIRILSGRPPLTSDAAECLASANATVAQMDAKVLDLAKNWNPTGFYTTSQVEQLVKMTHAMLSNAASVVEKQILSFDARGNKDALKIVLADIHRKMSEATVFTRARGQAEAAGIATIDAPGLKRWVTNSMADASGGIAGAAFVACMQPWWLGALATFMTFFNTVWAIAKTIVGVAVDLVREVVKVPDMISTLWTAAKWAVLIGGAWWAYENGPRHIKALGL